MLRQGNINLTLNLHDLVLLSVRNTTKMESYLLISSAEALWKAPWRRQVTRFGGEVTSLRGGSEEGQVTSLPGYQFSAEALRRLR